MTYWQAIGHDWAHHWYLYLSMPFVAAIIGYTTKLLAIRMMFQPLEFKGIRPFFGWQGVIPRNAERMASIATDTMLNELVSQQEIISRLDPRRMTKEIEKPLLDSVETIIHEVATSFSPGVWEAMPDLVRNRIIKRIKEDAPNAVSELLADIRDNIDRVFDLKHTVVTNLVRDKHILNRIFQEAGHKEFDFIAKSGIWFGFSIGLIQMTVWTFYKSAWVLPAFGLFIGWFTDWLALKMVFRPKQPTKYLFGLFEWQGLFLRRRKEVAADYGRLIAEEIITPRAIMDGVLRGPLSDKLFAMVHKHVQRAVDEQAGAIRPLVVLSIGSREYQQIKKQVAERMMVVMQETASQVEKYAYDAMDVQNTLIVKMQQLNEEQFEHLIRPAFEQDEWILIACGAALGFLVGELQTFLMLH
ncbi:MAG TPA: DUF445 domain-containing protein [Nevskiaceae bacterium]|nr:DUF445 domain-containing protein [Nevskiaceae bacterium]